MEINYKDAAFPFVENIQTFHYSKNDLEAKQSKIKKKTQNLHFHFQFSYKRKCRYPCLIQSYVLYPCMKYKKNERERVKDYENIEVKIVPSLSPPWESPSTYSAITKRL